MVFDAYRFFHNDGNISIAFVSNNSRTTLVAEYKLNDSLEQGNKEVALKIAEAELTLSSSALDKLKEEVEQNLNLVLAKGTSKLADIVMGTNGVKDVRSKASTMFDKYTKMVEAYHYAEDSVRGNIEDFTSLRSDMGMVYRDYAMKLIDIYGDSIKMVSPDLFDFKRIEWLDVDEMLKYVELEYNKLSENCAALMGHISDSFRASLQNSLQAYKSVSNGNKSLGLAMAGLAMLDHYMDASERTNRLKSDLSVFQTSVKHDATRIKADMGRLMVICKTLNDVVIPKANVFLRYGEKLMASDLKAMLDALYGDETVRPLEEKRRELQQQLKVLDMEMNDHLQNIDVYTSLINDITSTLESKRASYMDAKAKKPSKPFFLVNLLTFGTANKNYYRNYSEWNSVCFPLVREYESYQVDLKLDKEELDAHREAQTRIKNEYAKLSNELNKVSCDIRSKIVCSDELKMIRSGCIRWTSRTSRKLPSCLPTSSRISRSSQACWRITFMLTLPWQRICLTVWLYMLMTVRGYRVMPHRIHQPNTARRNWQRLLERWSNHCRRALLCLTVSLNSRCSSLTASWLRLPTTRS